MPRTQVPTGREFRLSFIATPRNVEKLLDVRSDGSRPGPLMPTRSPFCHWPAAKVVKALKRRYSQSPRAGVMPSAMWLPPLALNSARGRLDFAAGLGRERSVGALFRFAEFHHVRGGRVSRKPVGVHPADRGVPGGAGP